MDGARLNKYFNVFPIAGGGDKAPAIVDAINRKRFAWKSVRDEKLSDEYLSKYKEFGVVCGVDGLEVIDVDNHFSDAKELCGYIDDNYGLKEAGLLVIGTQNGGYHIYFKSDNCAGNQKLACRLNDKGKKEALVETRGDGGYVVYYDNIISGSTDSVPKLTTEQRAELIEICKSLDEIGAPEIQKPVPVEAEKPGEKYNNEGIEEVRGLLRQHGWKSENGTHWQRPGKQRGISATLGKVGNKKFYVFSSNADPFEPDTSYSLFAVFATLQHGGDYKAAAKELAQRYDMKPVVKSTKKETTEPAATGKWGVLREIIKDWDLHFRYSELMKTMEYKRNGGAWDKNTDIMIGDIIMEMETNRDVKSISKNKLQEMLLNRTICDVYNPIDNFINQIPKWDEKKRFADLVKYIILDKEEDPHYFITMLKKHLIRTLKCAKTDYVNRFVLAFHGPQEIGKTEFFKWLVPGDVYNDETIDPQEKDSVLALGRYLMINMDELDSLNKREVAKLKAFISKGDITKRVAYGRYDEKFRRVASLFGSTNKSDILADEHNTRWMILKVKGFRWKEYIKEIDPMMLWAECKYELEMDQYAGELTDKEKLIRDKRNNSEFLEVRPEGELITQCFSEGEDLYTASETMEILIMNFPELKQQLNFTQLGREMRRKFGDPKACRRNGKFGKYYKVSANDGVDLPMKLRDVGDAFGYM